MADTAPSGPVTRRDRKALPSFLRREPTYRERRDGQLPLSVQPHWGAPRIVVVEHNAEGHQGCSMMSSFPLANTWLTVIIRRGARITVLDWAGDIQAGLQ